MFSDGVSAGFFDGVAMFSDSETEWQLPFGDVVYRRANHHVP